METFPQPLPSPSPPDPLQLQHSDLSTSPSTSAYTLSLPKSYRRSSFPVSPQHFNLLPPGLGMQRGLSHDSDYHSATGFASPEQLQQPFTNLSLSQLRPSGLSDSSPITSTSSPSTSRKSSASSYDSNTSFSSDGSTTPVSSLASSALSFEPTSSTSSPNAAKLPSSASPAAKNGVSLLSTFDWGTKASGGVVQSSPATRSLSVSSGMDKAKREAVKGWEDPALAAARRALWDDVPDEVVAAKEEGTTPPEVFVEEEEGEAENETKPNEEVEVAEEWQLPPARSDPSTPTALTAPTTPLFSCLRNSPSSRSCASLPSIAPISTSFSSSSSSTSRSASPSASSATSHSLSMSVSFSAEPPASCETYSPEAYSRRGDAPVEKLSIRDWMELQGVREAVGLWSGKIGKWDETQATLQVPAGTGAGDACIPTGANSVGQGATVSERKGRTPCPLAAVVGVVQVARSTPNSPVSPCKNLPF
ncbi:hypothetical protein JCM11641_007514 [Rhodosporidiobolus odoratus]